MFCQKIISLKELDKFGSVKNLNERAKTLVKQQKKAWALARKNYEALGKSENRTFDFGCYKIKIQHNPERIRSSAAKTDAKSIAERQCFLCPANLPEEQNGILFTKKYLILTNPFPIFQTHLTISELEHTPQQVIPFFTDMLQLSRELYDFTVFYNGPKTGASAPDHFHFQAGEFGLLPVEHDVETLLENKSCTLVEKGTLQISAAENYLRRIFVIQSTEIDPLKKAFEFIVQHLPAVEDEEPLINLLSSYKNGKWRVILFPRQKQRPSHFYKTGEKQLIVGPASVEMGGVIILPREEDFKKIDKKIISEIYKEVTLNETDFTRVRNQLISCAI